MRNSAPEPRQRPVKSSNETHSRERGRRKDRYNDRRDEIVDLAASLFARKGYDATSIREIGEAAELESGALYYYIESKESLLEEIHNRVLDPLLAGTQAIAVLDENARTRLRMVSEALLEQIIERHDHVWVFLHEYRALAGERRATFRGKRASFEQLVLGLLNEGVRGGEFAITQPELVMLAFLGMHNYTYQWLGRQPSISAADLSELYCHIFFEGVAQARGAETDVRLAPIVDGQTRSRRKS